MIRLIADFCTEQWKLDYPETSERITQYRIFFQWNVFKNEGEIKIFSDNQRQHLLPADMY